MLGVVLNRAPLQGLGAVVYGYGYGNYTTGYAYEQPSKPRRGGRRAAQRPSALRRATGNAE